MPGGLRLSSLDATARSQNVATMRSLAFFVEQSLTSISSGARKTAQSSRNVLTPSFSVIRERLFAATGRTISSLQPPRRRLGSVVSAVAPHVEVAQFPCPTFWSDEACGAVLDTKLCPAQDLTPWLKRCLAAFNVFAT